MKRCLFLSLTLALILSGCGSKSTRAHGRVVDQNGAGVAGVVVSLGTSYSTTTDGNGDYVFSSLTAGDYALSAAGGDAGHYLTETVASVSVVAETNTALPTLTAYRLIGIGVIVESISEPGPTGRSPLSGSYMALKEIDVSRSNRSAAKPARSGMTRAATWSFLTDNITYIYLEWAPIAGATSYKVYFEATNDQIWESGVAHPGGDPAEFDGALYRAYLDLDQTAELGGRVTAAGVYGFQVVAELSGGGTLDLPVIQVSLGMVLENYPETITYTAATHILSWADVTGRSGFKARVCDGETGMTPVTDSGEALLSATNHNFSSDPYLDPGVYYRCYVDAQYLDATGWPAEITRGVGGFVY